MSYFLLKRRVDKYLIQIEQGESSALSALYDLTSKQLYALCYSYLKSRADSEDALSDTYLLAVKNIDKFKGSGGFNWLYTIAKNVCLNKLRDAKKTVFVDFYSEEETAGRDIPTTNPLQVEDESGIIALAQRTLNDNEFQIVVLRTINELRFKEIAKMLSGSENTVRWQYNNAIKKVKKEYEKGAKNER